MSGPQSQAWWAMVVLMLVAGAMYACVLFSYLYLWTVSPDVWPTAEQLPGLARPLIVALLLVASSAAMGLANRALKGRHGRGVTAGLVGAVLLFAGAFAVDLGSHAGVSPAASAYGAVVYLVLSMEGFFGVIVIVMALFALARQLAGRLDSVRRVTFDNARLYWHYTVVQSLLGLLVLHGFPRWVQ